MVIEKFRKLWESNDAEGLAELYSEDALLDMNMPGWRFQVQGPEATAARSPGTSREGPSRCSIGAPARLIGVPSSRNQQIGRSSRKGSFTGRCTSSSRTATASPSTSSTARVSGIRRRSNVRRPEHQ